MAAEFIPIMPDDIKMLIQGYEVLPDYVRLCLTMTGKTASLRGARTQSTSWLRKWMRCATRLRIATRPSS